jgi:hypothetical protein
MPPVVTWAATEIWGYMILGTRGFGSRWMVHLFVNFYQPTAYDTTGNYTECTWPGYSPFQLDPFEWVNTSGQNPVAQWAYPLLKWEFDPSGQAQQTVFGYYIEQDSILLYAEAFSAPFPIPPEGGQVPINLFWTDEQCAE